MNVYCIVEPCNVVKYMMNRIVNEMYQAKKCNCKLDKAPTKKTPFKITNVSKKLSENDVANITITRKRRNAQMKDFLLVGM